MNKEDIKIGALTINDEYMYFIADIDENTICLRYYSIRNGVTGKTYIDNNSTWKNDTLLGHYGNNHRLCTTEQFLNLIEQNHPEYLI